jgi:hypothetical protein
MKSITLNNITIKELNIEMRFDENQNAYLHEYMDKDIFGNSYKSVGITLHYFSNDYVILRFPSFLDSSYIYLNDVYFGHFQHEKKITKKHFLDVNFCFG